MKTLILLIFIIIFSSCSFLDPINTENKKSIYDSKKAISLCIENYIKISGNIFFSNVDRVYVLTANGKFDLLFTKGEMGIFGDRSDEYRSLLACGVLSSDSMNIYYLSEPLKDTLIELPGITQISEDLYHKAWDLLYMREGDSFKFITQQKFKPKKIEVMTGTILD